MQNLFQNKLIHFKLNLDYYQGWSKVEQTNLAISNLFTDFNIKFKNNIQNYTVVYEYRDDLIGKIGLTLISSISSVMGFDFYIYGKIKDKNKKKQRIKLRKLKKLDNVLLISNFNSIYKVINQPEQSKKFSPKIEWQIMENFTPEEIFILQEFYQLGYDREIDIKVKRIQEYINWTLNPCAAAPFYYILNTTEKIPLNLVWLENDKDYLVAALQDVVNSNVMCLYFTQNKQDIKYLPDIEFNKICWNKSNIPCKEYLNWNKIYRNKMIDLNNLNWVGNWPAKERLEIEQYLRGGNENECIYS